MMRKVVKIRYMKTIYDLMLKSKKNKKRDDNF